MHSWFTQKLNEMIGLAHYCQYPILKAHFVLTQKAVDEIYGEHRETDETSLSRILPLMISQAEADKEVEAAHHLRQAMQALGKKNLQAENVIELSFAEPSERRRQTNH